MKRHIQHYLIPADGEWHMRLIAQPPGCIASAGQLIRGNHRRWVEFWLEEYDTTTDSRAWEFRVFLTGDLVLDDNARYLTTALADVAPRALHLYVRDAL